MVVCWMTDPGKIITYKLLNYNIIYSKRETRFFFFLLIAEFIKDE